MKLKMAKDDLQAFLTAEFPQVDGKYMIQDLAPLEITVRMAVTEANLRPGGMISGPSMFALADISMYLAILAIIGRQALAVTTNCSIDFMRKPAAGVDMIGTAKVLKLGRVLAVGDVLLFSAGQAAPVARAGMTYSIPPKA